MPQKLIQTKTVTQEQSNHWQTGLCNCCGGDSHQSSNQCSFFCGGLFCPCIAQGYLQKHVGLSGGWVAPSCFYCCAAGCTSNLIPYISLFNLHQSVAHASGIKEGCLSTLCKVICCFPCTLSQINNEVILGHKKFEPDAPDCDCMHLLGCVGGKQLVDYDQAETAALMPQEVQEGVVMQNTMNGVTRPTQMYEEPVTYAQMPPMQATMQTTKKQGLRQPTTPSLPQMSQPAPFRQSSFSSNSSNSSNSSGRKARVLPNPRATIISPSRVSRAPSLPSQSRVAPVLRRSSKSTR